jgi:adenylate cyclase
MAEGRQALGVFERLSPRDASFAVTHTQIAISYYFERDYERSVEAARRLLSTHPGHTLTYRWMAAALGQLGRIEEARVALAAVSPREFDVYVLTRAPWMRPEDHEHMLDGLRKAGWQG